MKPQTHLLKITLLAAIIGVSANADAQRTYQRYWQKVLEEQEAPATIEDSAPQRKLDEERFLYGEDPAYPFNSTVFPGAQQEAPDFQEAAPPALLQFSQGTYDTESGNPSVALKAYQEAINGDPENSWYQLRLARSAMNLNDVARAQALMQNLLEREPENYRAMLLMGEINMLRQRFAEARNWYEQVIAIKSGNIEALQSLSQISYEIDRDMEATKRHALAILHIKDDHPHAMLWSAEASAFTGDIDRAIEMYTKLSRYRPALLDRMAEVGRRLTAMQRPEEAVRLVEGGLLIAPDHPALRRSWEEALMLSGGEQAVGAAWERLLESSGTDTRVVESYAQILRARGDAEGLKNLREKSLAANPDDGSALLDLANYHVMNNDMAKAQPYIDRLMKTSGDNVETMRQLSILLLATGNKTQATELLDKILETDPENPNILTTRALLAEDDPAKAEEFYRRAMEASPVDGQVLKRFARFLHQQGKKDRAREVYQQAVVAAPTDEESWLALARLYHEAADTASVRELQAGAEKRNPTNHRLIAGFGILEREFGNPERARELLQQAVVMAPLDMETRNNLAEVFLILGQPEFAVAAIAGIPNNAPATTVRLQERYLARIYEKSGRSAEAEPILLRHLNEEPENFRIRRELIECLVRQDKLAAAESIVSDAVRLYSTTRYNDTQSLLARYHSVSGNAGKAVPILEALVAQNPNDHNFRLDLALAQGEVDALDAAEENYRFLIALGPPETNDYYEVASNNLSHLFAIRGVRLDEAEQLALQALAVNPNAAYILDSVGWVYFKKGDYTQARTYLERAARIAVQDGEIFSNLGQLYETIGEKQLARDMYEKALKADPRMRVARERREALVAGGETDPKVQ